MRILYLLPGVGIDDSEKKRREAILNQIAFSGTEIEVRAVPSGPKSIESTRDEYEAMPAVLNFVLEHQQEYDAAIIGCAGDAGLAGTRELASIPVVGPGESSLLLGCPGGDIRFSMVTTSAARAASKHRLVRDTGFDPSRLVSSHSVDIPVLEMARNPERTLQELIRCIEDAKKKGAQVMVIGCMSLAFMEASLLKKASLTGGLPLINPIVTAVKMAESLVAMHQR